MRASARTYLPRAAAPMTARLSRARAVLAAVALAAATALAAPAAAQQLRFNGSTTGANAFGYLVGPFDATLQRPGVAVGLSVFCVDFLNAVTPGAVTPIAISSLAGDLDHTRHPASVDGYRRAAWLTDQFALTDRSRWGGIQAAIWNIFAPGNPNDGRGVNDPLGEAYWTRRVTQFAATPGYGTYDWSRFYVLTDVRAAGMPSGVGIQEFITSSPNVVPEPETWLMLGSGLAVVAVVAWRRRVRG